MCAAGKRLEEDAKRKWCKDSHVQLDAEGALETDAQPHANGALDALVLDVESPGICFWT